MQKYVMEAVGTFFLALAVTLASFPPNPMAIGFMLIALLYIGGHISGGHYNPAVSLSFFLQGRLSSENLFMYCLAQLIGGLFAMGMFGYLSGVAFDPDLPVALGMTAITLFEILLTAVLCLVILSVVLLDIFRPHSIQGIVIGFTLIALASLGTGAMFNPAIAASSMIFAIVRGGMYVGYEPIIMNMIAPLVGGVLASVTFNYYNK